MFAGMRPDAETVPPVYLIPHVSPSGHGGDPREAAETFRDSFPTCTTLDTIVQVSSMAAIAYEDFSGSGTSVTENPFDSLSEACKHDPVR